MEKQDDMHMLISWVYDWAKNQESIITRYGIGLTADQEIDAFLAGVKEPGKIKLLKTDRIPFPDSLMLKEKMEAIGFLTDYTMGLTMGHGIYLTEDAWDKREVHVHEFVHVMQFEKLGFREFIHQYITECFSLGYPFGPLEMEARRIEKNICDRRM